MASLDYARPLTPSGNLRRRQLVDRIMRGGATAAAVIAVAILVLVIYAIVQRGASAISFTFLTKNPSEGFGIAASAGGGIANAIIGSGLIVAVATVIALPFGVLIAIFLTEFATPRAAAPVRLALDLLYGLPSIVVALFIYGLLVVGHSETGLYASIALAIIMLPLIARTTSESLLLVPRELRDASHALGISRWRTTLGITIPGALGGIITGTVLAIARAAGETAPMLLLSQLFDPSQTTVNVFGAALPNIPYEIFNFSEEGGPGNLAKAWGSALVLIAFVLIANLAARAIQARSRRMMTR
jgi:phosphate transport system permease protein